MRISFFFLFISTFVFSQAQYPKDYFRSPLDIPLLTSGSFGELRSNHFHAGLDFKTQQKEGLNVYAAGDGYVSRIKVSTWGYGRAIYITHPNGYTTLYGHLSKYAGAINDYAKKKHYEAKSFEIDVFPEPGAIKVKKGDIIALSGNSGGSGGPHLHFEFRDSKTERIINPMEFGFDVLVKDTKMPVVAGVMAYPISDSASVNNSQKPILLQLSQQKDGSYIAEKVNAQGKIGFGINTYDLADFTTNRNGTYSVKTSVNGTPFFGYQFESFGFDESHYINALIDYPRFKKTGQRYQKLFMKSPYDLTIIQPGKSNGIITVLPNVTTNYKIELSDFNGNKRDVTIPIAFEKQEVVVNPDAGKTPYFLKAKNDYNYKKDNVTVFIPANTFYEDFYLNFDVRGNALYLADEEVPIRSNLNISFEDASIAEADKPKTYIATANGNSSRYNATTFKGNVFSTWTKGLGRFMLAKDTVAPRITNLNFTEGKWLTKQNTIQFDISDGQSGIGSYNAYMNGKWILLEYDYKTRRVVHYFDEAIVAEGKNDLKIVVTDNVGNSTTFETNFFRSQLK